MKHRNDALRAVFSYLTRLNCPIDIVFDPRVEGAVTPSECRNLSSTTFSTRGEDPSLRVTPQQIAATTRGLRIRIPWSAITEIAASGGRFGVRLPPCTLPDTLSAERLSAPPPAGRGRPKQSKQRAKALGIRRIK